VIGTGSITGEATVTDHTEATRFSGLLDQKAREIGPSALVAVDGAKDATAKNIS
jgi:hypothetical protein